MQVGEGKILPVQCSCASFSQSEAQVPEKTTTTTIKGAK